VVRWKSSPIFRIIFFPSCNGSNSGRASLSCCSWLLFSFCAGHCVFIFVAHYVVCPIRRFRGWSWKTAAPLFWFRIRCAFMVRFPMGFDFCPADLVLFLGWVMLDLVLLEDGSCWICCIGFGGCYCISGGFVWCWGVGGVIRGDEEEVSCWSLELLMLMRCWCVWLMPIRIGFSLIFRFSDRYQICWDLQDSFLSRWWFPSLLRFAGLFVSGWPLSCRCWLFGGGLWSDCLGSLFTGIHQLLSQRAASWILMGRALLIRVRKLVSSCVFTSWVDVSPVIIGVFFYVV
jgi:hypothetical protein